MYKNDINFGDEKEKELLEIIKRNLDNDLQKIEYRYSVFDFSSNNSFVELKSRRGELNKYPDTMIGLNKIKKASRTSLPVYFVFYFTDGLYYWKYKEGEYEIRDGGRVDRGRPEIKKYCFIKNDNLIKIE
jgi:hypothetical protein